MADPAAEADPATAGETAADAETAAAGVAAAEAVARSARALRYLYLFRTGFSAFWVALVFSLASAPAADGRLGWLAASLLVVYPVSDAVATFADIRSGRIAAGLVQWLNLAADLAAAVAVLVAVQSGLGAAITVFGAWAVVSGAVMIYLAVRRQRPLGGQWLLVISGAGSVLAGTTFVGWTGSASAGLDALAQYSAGGAIWYLLTALWLSRSRSRRAQNGNPSAHSADEFPRSWSSRQGRGRQTMSSSAGPKPARW